MPLIKDDVDPQLNAEEGKDGFVPIEDDDEEEVVYVDDESQIPNEEEPVAPAVAEKPSIEEILEKQGNAQTKVLQDLGSLLNQRNTAQAQPSQPQMSEEEFAKKFTDGVFKDPVKAMDEYMRRKVAPYVGQLSQQNFKLKRALLETKDDTKELMKDYKDEIENEIRNLPPHMQNNPDALDQVLDVVRGRHTAELVTKYKDDLKAEILKEMQEAGQLKTPGSGGTPTHISAGGVQAGGAAKNRPVYRLKPTRKEEEFARVKGMDIKDVQDYFKENGIDRN